MDNNNIDLSNNTDISNNDLDKNNNPFKFVMDAFNSAFSFAFPIVNINKDGNNQNNIFFHHNRPATGAVLPINRLGVIPKK
jgi:hypothetical protein